MTCLEHFLGGDDAIPKKNAWIFEIRNRIIEPQYIRIVLQKKKKNLTKFVRDLGSFDECFAAHFSFIAVIGPNHCSKAQTLITPIMDTVISILSVSSRFWIQTKRRTLNKILYSDRIFLLRLWNKVSEKQVRILFFETWNAITLYNMYIILDRFYGILADGVYHL